MYPEVIVKKDCIVFNLSTWLGARETRSTPHSLKFTEKLIPNQVRSYTSVRLDTSQAKDLISDDRLLKRLGPVLRADLPISHRLLLGGANVAKLMLVMAIVEIPPHELNTYQ